MAADLVRITGGEFLYGSTDADVRWARQHYAGLTEKHFGAEERSRVRSIGTYAIERHPVTNARYAEFIDAGGYRDRRWWSEDGWAWVRSVERAGPRLWHVPEWQDWRRGDYPVVGVSWFEADAYARWRGMRLPTEAEWERAARGVDGRRFPWGQEFHLGNSNTADIWLGREIRTVMAWMREFVAAKPWREQCLTTAVGSFPGGASPDGLHDVAGNVWEWCADSAADGERVCRGGSFGYFAFAARTTDRGHHPPQWCGLGNGFRCVA